jgi:hypothetical protein
MVAIRDATAQAKEVLQVEYDRLVADIAAMYDDGQDRARILRAAERLVTVHQAMESLPLSGQESR